MSKVAHIVRIPLVLLAFVVLLYISSCGDSGGGGDDVTAPTVSSVIPADGATDVAITSTISATFSEAMDSSTITTSTFTVTSGSAVTGSVGFSDRTATFTPSSNFSYSTTYTVNITTNVQDTSGNALENTYTWSFTTTAEPISAPAAPENVTATAGDGQVTINWSAVTGAVSYNVYWSTVTGVTTTTGTEIDAGNNIIYTHTGLTNGVTYYYIVTAVNTAGESSASDPEQAATPALAIPGAPTNVSAAAGDELVNINWNAVTGADSYSIYWSTVTGVTISTGSEINVGNNITYQHTGLTNGVTYYYIVTAVNTAGESSASDPEQAATPQPPPPTVGQWDSATWDLDEWGN